VAEDIVVLRARFVGEKQKPQPCGLRLVEDVLFGSFRKAHTSAEPLMDTSS
jgi:hypothetical protein